METVVIALGGNAFLQKGQKGTVEEQWNNVVRAMKQIADIIECGYRVVLTHGNGPQVGNILVWMESAKERIPPLTMDIAGAMTQGWLGYMIQQALRNELRRRGLNKVVVSIVNQVLVDKNDPAFQNPTKYVGPYYTEEEAKKIAKEKGWTMKPDPRGGWRRVVPSPDPKDNLEIDAIRALVEAGFIVVASGGGGIPVINEDGEIKGVEAVIDKDLAGEILASKLGADYFIILTDVEGAMINFGKPNQKMLRKITVSEAEKYYKEGHFKPGSMGPKVLACIRFIKHGGKKAAIGHLYRALDTLEEKTGTIIVPD
ncbi:carbamate kinase [candidate division Kazan bacterium]|uniref:Carbamate kinase n=1 Tax=candidate division Kazan bacterium TaxID=2202143 RepID=A0A420ZB11_UNCK3|nr:MAG: carbamate kinase [candidate division Kazan bacterium]